MSDPLSRRDLLKHATTAAAALMLPFPLRAADASDPDHTRLAHWTATLRADGLSRPDVPLGRAAVRVGELAAGTPYEPGTLEAYLRAGGSPATTEPLALSLTRFDCVTLVESCLAVARIAGQVADADSTQDAAGGHRAEGAPRARSPRPSTWDRFAREIERMRYRGGVHRGYASRLHYFSEWIRDGAARGLVHDLGAELGGAEDARPLRFMTEHRTSYPALRNDEVFREIGAVERQLDGHPRHVVPTKLIPQVTERIDTGDVLAFATAIPGLDVSHTAFAYRDRAGTLRVLHAPLSGGVVEITRATLPEYVAAIRRATGILVARPLR